jgi:hypothetical protein
MSVKWTPALGLPVVKAAQNLPQTATATLFTVSGGAVLVTGLLGLVTTALGATATNLTVGTANDSGASIIAATTTITSKPVGTIISPTSSAGVGGAGSLSTALFVANYPYAISPFLVTGNITWTTSASNTGQVKWYLWYIPLDLDALVS